MSLRAVINLNLHKTNLCSQFVRTNKQNMYLFEILKFFFSLSLPLYVFALGVCFIYFYILLIRCRNINFGFVPTIVTKYFCYNCFVRAYVVVIPFKCWPFFCSLRVSVPFLYLLETSLIQIVCVWCSHLWV